MIHLVSNDDDQTGEPIGDAVGEENGVRKQSIPPNPDDEKDPRRVFVARCKSAGLKIEEVPRTDDKTVLKLGMKNGKDFRWLIVGSDENIAALLSVPFERFVFLSDYVAICSYLDGLIEAEIRPITPFYSSFMLDRLFNSQGSLRPFDPRNVNVVIEPSHGALPRIEISAASDTFMKLTSRRNRMPLTLKLGGCVVKTHEEAVGLLRKTSDSIFFQIDLLANVALTISREHRPSRLSRRPSRKANLVTELQYPKTEFDEAPLSLYWYGRSAAGMPLLQFLAFYQVIEFYFPIYSKAEAQRKLKAILKDPTFRGDRDADIGRLLSAIHVSRSGAYGDERSQLRATLMECIDPTALRDFLESEPDRKEFYSAKVKGNAYQRIPLATPSADLRNEVADRIYDIRCKIVHTKSDSRDGEVELLLPFSPEAQAISIDVELAQYLAHSVLIAGSMPFRGNS